MTSVSAAAEKKQTVGLRHRAAELHSCVGTWMLLLRSSLLYCC